MTIAQCSKARVEFSLHWASNGGAQAGLWRDVLEPRLNHPPAGHDLCLEAA